MKRCKYFKLLLIFSSVVFLYPFFLFAGGPWVVDGGSTGKAYKWKDNSVKWYSETGDLGSAKNETAVGWVEEAMNIWENAGLLANETTKIKTSAIDFRHTGVINGDIHANNYKQYVKSDDPSGYTVVIFDSDGAILEDMGIGSFVVGLTLPKTFDEDNLNIINAYTIMNGTYTWGESNAGEFGKDEQTVTDLMKATITHEVGHLLNLDHTFANQEIDDALDAGDAANAQHLPTMYPLSKTTGQMSLTRDDVVSVSAVYPKVGLTNNFCIVAGKIEDANGGFQGAGVVVRSTTDPWNDAFSAVTGSWYPKNTKNGDYTIYGLMVGRTYTIKYMEIKDLTHDCSDEYRGSSIEPYCPARSGFGEGVITSGDGSLSEIKCETPGQVITMDTVKLSGDGEEGGSGSEGEAKAGGSSKSGCSLLKGGSVFGLVYLAFLLPLLTVIILRRKS